MARRCTVCAHPEAHAINLALLGSASVRDVAGRYGLSRTAVGNHAAHHVRQRIAEGSRALASDAPSSNTAEAAELAQLVRQQAENQATEGATLRAHLATDLARLDRLYALAVANGNLAAATRVIGTRWHILGRAGVLPELDANPTTPPPVQKAAEVDSLHGMMAEMAEAVARLGRGELLVEEDT